MHIEELGKGEEEEENKSQVGEEEGEKKIACGDKTLLFSGGSIILLNTKRALVGVGARALFYPTLVYNIVRNKVEADFRWWDRICQFILLGAVPFPSDVPWLKEIGVEGVITLNEAYETLVPSSLYKAYGIDHLVIATRDYCFAPSMNDICLAVDFIHRNASLAKTTYVHCKAGRGRSTTIVTCYLVKHKNMTPKAAYAYVKSIRPRVLLAASQLQAVQDFYDLKVRPNLNKDTLSDCSSCVAIVPRNLKPPSGDLVLFDDGSVVVVTQADLEGYDPRIVEPVSMGAEIWADLSVVYRVKVAGQAALARISCLWLRCRAQEKLSEEKLMNTPGSLGGSISVDIQVY